MWQSFNVENWGRQKAFDFYKNFDDPYFNLTVNVDVTKLLSNCKKNKQSFFLTTLHTALIAVNAVDNFKMRFYGNGVKIYDVIHGGSTLFYDDESFGFGYYDFCESRNEFIVKSQKIIAEANAQKSFNPSEGRDDLIYFSALPWVSFTSFKHAQDKLINASIPRITFGKYFAKNDIYMMPVNIEVNHALMDGYHVGLFVKHFQKELDSIL